MAEVHTDKKCAFNDRSVKISPSTNIQILSASGYSDAASSAVSKTSSCSKNCIFP